MSKQARTVTNPDDPVVARAVDLVKTYGDTDSQVTALNHVSVEFQRGELTAIMGPSGSGRSRTARSTATGSGKSSAS